MEGGKKPGIEQAEELEQEPSCGPEPHCGAGHEVFVKDDSGLGDELPTELAGAVLAAASSKVQSLPHNGMALGAMSNQRRAELCRRFLSLALLKIAWCRSAGPSCFQGGPQPYQAETKMGSRDPVEADAVRLKDA